MVKKKKAGYFVKNLNAIGHNKDGLITKNLNNISKPLYKRKNKRGLMQLE